MTKKQQLSQRCRYAVKKRITDHTCYFCGHPLMIGVIYRAITGYIYGKNIAASPLFCPKKKKEKTWLK